MEIGNHLSAVLVADFAASAHDALAAITDPAERSVRTQEFLQTLVRVRRQDSQAGKLAIERERRARERAKEMEEDDWRDKYQREDASFIHIMKRSMMADSFASPNLLSQAAATGYAESLLRGAKLAPSDPTHSSAPDKPQSN